MSGRENTRGSTSLRSLSDKCHRSSNTWPTRTTALTLNASYATIWSRMAWPDPMPCISTGKVTDWDSVGYIENWRCSSGPADFQYRRELCCLQILGWQRKRRFLPFLLDFPPINFCSKNSIICSFLLISRKEQRPFKNLSKYIKSVSILLVARSLLWSKDCLYL